MRVLLIENDASLQTEIGAGFRGHGVAMDVATDGTEALDKIWVNGYDVVVLDRDMSCDGRDELCQEIINCAFPARILMLQGVGSVEDCVESLSIGADDYLAKPFVMDELLARIHALNRRNVAPTSPVLVHDDIQLEPARHLASRSGKDLGLTRKEFGVLKTLMAADGKVVSAEELLEKVWDENVDPFTNAVRVAMMTLRRKLGDPPVIETVTGVGYRLGSPTG